MFDIAKLGLVVDSSGVKQAERDLDQFGKTSGVAAAGAKKLGLAIATAIGATASIGAAVRTIREFETNISKLEAVTGASAREMADMRNIAKELGSTTEFSSAQAASGLTFLGMAGFDAAEGIAAIPDVLDLATASGMGLAESADIASNVLSGFGKEAKEAGEVADVLAAASSRANTDVSQLGQAMSTVAPIAAALNIGLSDTAAAIGVLSDAGIQGARAGTAMRGILASLAGPSNDAAKALKSLGVSVEDVNPEAHSLSKIMKRLQEAGISTADAMTIFGREAASGALVLVEGNNRLREFGQELRNVDGAAADMAATVRDNLGGDIDSLTSAIAGLGLALGEAGLTAILRFAVQGVTNFVRVVTSGVEKVGSFIDLLASFFKSESELEQAIDNSTIAMGDQIKQSALLEARMGNGNIMTLEAARVNLASAQARYEDIQAMEAQNLAIAKQELGLADVATKIANAQLALSEARSRLTSEDIEYSEIYGDEYVSDSISLVNELERNLVGLLNTQKVLNEEINKMDFLSPEQEKAQAVIKANIERLIGAIDESKDGLVVFNGEVNDGVVLSTRLSEVAREINFGTATSSAQKLAQTLGVSVGLAQQLANIEAGLGAHQVNHNGLDALDPRNPNNTRPIFDGPVGTVSPFDASRQVSLSTKSLGSGGGGGSAATAAQKEFNDLQREAERWVRQTETALESYNRELEDLQKLNELGYFSEHPEAYARAVEMVRDEYEKTLPFAEEMAQMQSAIKGGIDGVIRALVSGEGDWKEAISSMARELQFLIIQMQVYKALSLAFPTVFGSSGSIPLVTGARAEGGPVEAGKTYLVGEKGPELRTFSSNGYIVPNDKLVSGGSDVNVSVPVNIVNKTDSNVTAQRNPQTGGVDVLIERAVQTTLVSGKADRAMAQRFGVKPVAGGV